MENKLLQTELELMAKQYGFRYLIDRLANAMDDEAGRQTDAQGLIKMLEDSAKLLREAAGVLPYSDRGMYKWRG